MLFERNITSQTMEVLEHIFTELDLGAKYQKKLLGAGVTSLEILFEKKLIFENGEIEKRQDASVFEFIKWYESFVEKKEKTSSYFT